MNTSTQTSQIDTPSLSKDSVFNAHESRFSAAHYSEALTAFSTGYKDPENLSDLLEFIAPSIPVGRRFEFKRANNSEAFLSESDDVRAIGASLNASNTPAIPSTKEPTIKASPSASTMMKSFMMIGKNAMSNYSFNDSTVMNSAEPSSSSIKPHTLYPKLGMENQIPTPISEKPSSRPPIPAA